MPSKPSDEITDALLLREIAAGHQPAFVELFRRHRNQVFRFALHMTASQPTADDVTQDVFLAVMRDARRYDASRASVVSWLYGITRNFVRRRADGDRAFEPLDAVDDVMDTWKAGNEPDPLGKLTRAEDIETLRRAVHSLPVRYREVVVLCDLQELSYADAADALGCAVGTVRSRLHRGRTLLADKLRDHGAVDVKVRGTRCLA